MDETTSNRSDNPTEIPIAATDSPADQDRSLVNRPTLSIRAKIVLCFSLVFVLCAAISVFAIWMVRDIDPRIRFLEVAGNLLSEIQKARRFEKNYLLYGTNLDDCVSHLQKAQGILERHSETIAEVVGKERFTRMVELAADYDLQLTRLAGNDYHQAKELIVPNLRDDGARMVAFSEDFLASERDNVDNTLRMAKHGPLVFLSGLLVVMLIVATALARHLLSTLKRFTRYTERISAGDFTPIAPVRKYRDEFSMLAEAFNRMTRELARRHDILVESHKLRAIGTLVAGVAHELNNPLNNTLLSAMTLKEDRQELAAAQREEIVDDIISETERSQRIVRNLLDFARESEAQIEPLNIRQIITESVRLVANQVRLHRIKLESHFEDALPHVHGDAQMLKQVFVNLILNAADVLAPGEHISITVRQNSKEGYVTVEVKDDGPGMPAHIRQRIFEPFFTTKTNGKGTGLGLSVSQGIIRSLGGFMRVYSQEGVGTSFLVGLPITIAPSQVMSGQEGLPDATGS